MKPVLWIEDMARTELGDLFAAVFTSVRYSLDLAADPTEAIERIRRVQYAAIIVDIRLPPGDDSRWVQLYSDTGGVKPSSKLGVHLVSSLLRAPDARVELRPNEVPSWVAAEVFGFCTVEPWSEQRPVMEHLGIIKDVYKEKGPQNNRDMLLKLIDVVVARSGR